MNKFISKNTKFYIRNIVDTIKVCTMQELKTIANIVKHYNNGSDNILVEKSTGIQINLNKLDEETLYILYVYIYSVKEEGLLKK